MTDSENTSGEIVIEARSAVGRVVLLVVLTAVIAFVWFAVRLQLGNMLAQLTPTTRADAAEVATVAVGMAPSDPSARWLAASMERAASRARAHGATSSRTGNMASTPSPTNLSTCPPWAWIWATTVSA